MRKFISFFSLFFIFLFVLGFNFVVADDVGWNGGCPDSYSEITGSIIIYEWSYDIPVSGNITNFSWYVNPNYLSLNEWKLYINGVFFSNGTGTYDLSCSPHVMYFNNATGHVMTNETVVFEMVLTGTTHTGMELALKSSTDTDSDGDIYCQAIAATSGNYMNYVDGIVVMGERTGFWDNHEPCYWFNISNYTSQEYSSYVESYRDTFGDFYAEFLFYNESCHYNVGDYPYIVYYLNDTLFSNLSYYKYIVYDAEDNAKTTGVISFVGSTGNGTLKLTYNGFSAGQYILKLYNVSEDGLVDHLVYTSQPLVICPQDDDVVIEDEDAVATPSDWEDGRYSTMLGLALALGFGIAGAYVGGAMGFVGTFFGSMVVFSIPGTLITFFPTWVVFIGGLFLVALLVTSFRR